MVPESLRAGDGVREDFPHFIMVAVLGSSVS
jgi:hypothetical protein